MTFHYKNPDAWEYAVKKASAEYRFIQQVITDRLPNYDALCGLGSKNYLIELSPEHLRESLRIIDNILRILRSSIVKVCLIPKGDGIYTAQCSLIAGSRELTTMEQHRHSPGCGDHRLNLEVIRNSIAYLLDQRSHKSPPPAGAPPPSGED